MKKQSPNFLSALKNLVLPAAGPNNNPVTNKLILEELIKCFDDSCEHESVGTSLLFNTHFLIILHPAVYETHLAALPVIVQEAVKVFYKNLEFLKKDYEAVSPVSSSWHFKFGPGVDFNGESIGERDIRIIGMLTGLKESNSSDGQGASNRTARVTIRSKQTNVFDRMDINVNILRHIHFLESGTFEVQFNPDLKLSNTSMPQGGSTSAYKPAHFASLTYYLADKSREEKYLMKDKEIVIARKEPSNQSYSNYLLIESAYVSNPHARIRLNEASGNFQIASFSRNETRINEKIITKSEPTNPLWVDLDNESKLLLNGMVTLHFKNLYKS